MDSDNDRINEGDIPPFIRQCLYSANSQINDLKLDKQKLNDKIERLLEENYYLADCIDNIRACLETKKPGKSSG